MSKFELQYTGSGYFTDAKVVQKKSNRVSITSFV